VFVPMQVALQDAESHDRSSPYRSPAARPRGMTNRQLSDVKAVPSGGAHVRVRSRGTSRRQSVRVRRG
jgi:hypothetical protein